MSDEKRTETEKALLEQVKALPQDVQDQFLLMAQGAAMAADAVKKALEQRKEKTA